MNSETRERIALAMIDIEKWRLETDMSDGEAEYNFSEAVLSRIDELYSVDMVAYNELLHLWQTNAEGGNE